MVLTPVQTTRILAIVHLSKYKLQLLQLNAQTKQTLRKLCSQEKCELCLNETTVTFDEVKGTRFLHDVLWAIVCLIGTVLSIEKNKYLLGFRASLLFMLIKLIL